MPGQSALQKRTPGSRPDDARYPRRTGQLAAIDAGGKLPVTITKVVEMYPGGSQGAATEARGLAIRGRYAYVAANNHLYVMDVSIPSAPVKLADLNDLSAGGSQDAVLRGKYLYLLCRPGGGANGISVIDVSNPSAPVSVGSVNDGTNIASVLSSIEVKGRYAYVTSQNSGAGTGNLTIYNISGTTPVFCGVLTSSNLSGVVDVRIRGKYAFAATAAGPLAVVDVSNPYAPALVTTRAGGQGNAALSGRYLYTAGNNSLAIYDVSAPSNPSLIGTYTDSTTTGLGGGALYLNSAFRVHVAGRYLYVASRLGNGLAIFDVSTPTTPVLVATYTAGATPSTLDHPVSVYARGRYLYVSCGSYATFAIYDIGGVEHTAAKIDTLAAATVDVSEDLQAERISAAESIYAGFGGLKSDGPVVLEGGASHRSGSGAPAIEGVSNRDFYWRIDGTTGTRLYVCTTSGATGTAVWTAIL